MGSWQPINNGLVFHAQKLVLVLSWSYGWKDGQWQCWPHQALVIRPTKENTGTIIKSLHAPVSGHETMLALTISCFFLKIIHAYHLDFIPVVKEVFLPLGLVGVLRIFRFRARHWPAAFRLWNAKQRIHYPSFYKYTQTHKSSVLPYLIALLLL